MIFDRTKVKITWRCRRGADGDDPLAGLVIADNDCLRRASDISKQLREKRLQNTPLSLGDDLHEAARECADMYEGGFAGEEMEDEDDIIFEATYVSHI